eukprot:EG_transcript_18017
MDAEEAAVLRPLSDPPVHPRFRVLPILFLCVAATACWLAWAGPRPPLRNVVRGAWISPVPTWGRTRVLRFPLQVTLMKAQAQTPAQEVEAALADSATPAGAWNIIEYCDTLTVPQLRDYLADRGLFGHSRYNRSSCMDALRQLEGEERWAQYEADLQGKQQVEEPLDNLIAFCNSLTITQLRTYLFRRGVTGCSRLSRVGLMGILKRLEGDERWAEHERIFLERKSQPAPESDEDEPSTSQEQTPQMEIDLLRRRAYYNTLNVKQLRKLLAKRGETMYSDLNREACLERLRRGDEEGMGLVEVVVAEPSPPPQSEVRRQLETLTAKELRRVAQKSGMEGYAKMSKPEVV